MDTTSGQWKPTAIRWVVRSLEGATETVQVMTDQGEGFLKALGNDAGPHALACELVGTRLARWLGLPTLDLAIIGVGEHPKIPLARGGVAQPGPAIITRAEAGMDWGGDKEALARVANPHDITRLVIFDTWTLKVDRHPPRGVQWRPNLGNVFLSFEGQRPGEYVLKAIDHTHCFTRGRPITARIATIGRVKDKAIYGRFKEFEPHLQAAVRVARSTAGLLLQFTKATAREVVNAIPREWSVDAPACEALAELIADRAAFVGETIVGRLIPGSTQGAWWQNAGGGGEP